MPIDTYEKCQNVESHNSPPNGMERSTPDNGSRRNKGRVVIRGNKLIGAATQCAGASDADRSFSGSEQTRVKFNQTRGLAAL